MPYLVLNKLLNHKSNDQSSYASMIESALNNLSQQGFELVQIEQASHEDGETLYIFRTQQEG